MSKKKYSVISQNRIAGFNKILKVDSDKSISIRTLLISSISQGISKIDNILESEDIFSTIECLRKLGVKIKKIKKSYFVYGKGFGSFAIKNNAVLNCGNSGTLTRLLIGILSTTPGLKVNITGDKSLKKRNMTKLIDLMSKFGASFSKKKSYLPFQITSSSMPLGIKYKSGISAQLKSAVILAGLNSFGTTNILENESNKSRNHTENLLLNNSGVLSIKKNEIKVFGKKALDPFNISVPGDPSSAAFFCALALFTENSNLKIKNICLNSRRLGFYKLLKRHGAKIVFTNIKRRFNETIGDIHVKSSKISPIKAGSYYYPSTADEYVILSVCAAMIPGISVFKGISDLSNKESSRALEMKKILKQIGIKCILTKSEMRIFGSNEIKVKKKYIVLKNLLDHRICMATVCLSLLTGVKSFVKNFETVETSSPSFLKIIKLIGGKYEVR